MELNHVMHQKREETRADVPLTASDPPVVPNGRFEASVRLESIETQVALPPGNCCLCCKCTCHHQPTTPTVREVATPTVREVGIQADCGLCVSYSPKVPSRSSSHPDLCSQGTQNEVMELCKKNSSKLFDSVGNIALGIVQEEVYHTELPPGVTDKPQPQVEVDSPETTAEATASRKPRSRSASKSRNELINVQEDDYATVADAIALASGEMLVVPKKTSVLASPGQHASLPKHILKGMHGTDDYCEVIFLKSDSYSGADEPREGRKVKRTHTLPKQYRDNKEEVVMLKDRSFSLRSKLGRNYRRPEDTLPSPPPQSLDTPSHNEKEETPLTEISDEPEASPSQKRMLRCSSLPTSRHFGAKTPLAPSNHNPEESRQRKATTLTPPPTTPTKPPLPVRPRTEYTHINLKKKKKNRKVGESDESDMPPTHYTVEQTTPTPVATPPFVTSPTAKQSVNCYEEIRLSKEIHPSIRAGYEEVAMDTVPRLANQSTA